MDGDAGAILTIGHSNHALGVFLDLLTGNGVTAVADVRSAPFSRFHPHFNRERLAEALRTSGIEYVHLGRELGGRPDDRSCYERGRVRYDRVARTAEFRGGLQRVVGGAEKHRIALMCAEREPLHCHRTLLVGHELDKRGVEVAHVLSDGRIEPHASAMTRLLAELGLEAGEDLFRRHGSRDELVAEAIARQARRIGHALAETADATERKDR